jgi:hypothetical protein
MKKAIIIVTTTGMGKGLAKIYLTTIKGFGRSESFFICVELFFNGHMNRLSSNEVNCQLNSSLFVTNLVMAYFIFRNKLLDRVQTVSNFACFSRA